MKHLSLALVAVGVLLSSAHAATSTNIALASNGGTAIFGYNAGTTASLKTLGFAYDHAGSPTYLNDGVTNGNNGDDTWPVGPDGYVGALFTMAPNTQIFSIVLYGRDFSDGGWFGVHSMGPAGPNVGGNPTIAASNLIAPTVQFTKDGGVTWTSDPFESNDYVTQLTGAIANGGAPTNAATFTLTFPLVNVDGVRLIGSEGGTAGDNGFIGADEIEVISAPEPSTWAMLSAGVGLLGFCVRRKLA